MLRYVKRNENPTWFERPDDMPEALHRLLVERGVGSAEAAAAFLNPGSDSLHDPLLLSGMEAAVARVRAAMAAGEAICVYGDYDVDGVCASAILSGWLRAQGADARVYLPSRHSEGYGLNEGAIREIAGWARLLVTVDCGVTSVELVALARSLGLDVIVTDHHRPASSDQGLRLPDCAVVNPLLADYPFPHLCGAGVAWKLVWALGGEAAAMAWVDVAALATVADVVPLTGENRAIVKLGLDRINAAPRTGVAALIEVSGLSGKRITATSIAFQLAPRLNAGGRLGSAMRALALVSAADPGEAAALAAELDRENADRRQIEQRILAEAEAQLADFDFPAHRALILAGRDWNPGVIGLAASRLVERYHYPVVLLADQGERMTGSCRSIEGVDIHAALTGCAGVLERFGGHRQAAGLTLPPENLEAFRAAMDAWLFENAAPEVYIPTEAYDTELDFESVTPGLIAALEGLQPTGFGNPAPVFRAGAEVVEARAVGAEGAHLKLTLAQAGRRLGGIAFGAGPRAARLAGRVDALFVPKLNTYMGRTEPQLEVRALGDGEPLALLRAKADAEPRLQYDFLTEVLYNRSISGYAGEIAVTDAGAVRAWMEASPQGTLVLASDLEAAARLLETLAGAAPDLYVGALPEDPRAFNAVCVCPPPGAPGRGYRRVVLAGLPPEALSAGTRAEVLRLPERSAWAARLPELEQLRAAYRGLSRVVERPAYCRTLGQLAHLVAEETALDGLTALASILAMADMGLFELEPDARPMGIRRSARRKVEPEESAAWRALRRWRGEL